LLIFVKKKSMAAKYWLELFQEGRKCFVLCAALLLISKMKKSNSLNRNTHLEWRYTFCRLKRVLFCSGFWIVKNDCCTAEAWSLN
jgi:hypothetical protein